MTIVSLSNYTTYCNSPLVFLARAMHRFWDTRRLGKVIILKATLCVREFFA